jgi:hypothetical protein
VEKNLLRAGISAATTAVAAIEAAAFWDGPQNDWMRGNGTKLVVDLR